jgi:hypothetical protein
MGVEIVQFGCFRQGFDERLGIFFNCVRIMHRFARFVPSVNPLARQKKVRWP